MGRLQRQLSGHGCDEVELLGRDQRQEGAPGRLVALAQKLSLVLDFGGELGRAPEEKRRCEVVRRRAGLPLHGPG
jgi:hypothetical protein